MRVNYTVFSSICEPLLAFSAVLLQIISLCTSWWATFTARTDLGKPEENGHYGLWTLCSTKAPHWREDCDPLDTFFEVSPYITVSGILCGIHLLLIVFFIPVELIQSVQVFKKENDLCIRSRILLIIKVSVALSSTFIAVLIAVFASIGDNDRKEYLVHKGWSFWIQISIIFLDVTIFVLCVTECIKFWRFQQQQQFDPEGKRAETYGNPSFDAESPEMPRSQRTTNGAIAFTESSGYPYGQNPTNDGNAKNLALRGKSHTSRDSNQTLTYENECYLESSPRSERRQ